MKTLTSKDQIERAQIGHHVNRLHVSATDEAVAADIRAAIEPHLQANRCTEGYARKSVAYALKCHHKNQALYRFVMSGGHGYTTRG